MVILGISNDPPAKNRKFREKYGFPYDLLSDEDTAVAFAYGAAEGVGAGRANRISYVIGPEGTIRKAYHKVKAAEHPEQVLVDLA